MVLREECLYYTLHGFLFHLCWLNARTKTLKQLILEAMFGDNCALMAYSESDLPSHYCQVSWSIAAFWDHNQPQQDRGTVPHLPKALWYLIWRYLSKELSSRVNHFNYLGSVIFQMDHLTDSGSNQQSLPVFGSSMISCDKSQKSSYLWRQFLQTMDIV